MEVEKDTALRSVQIDWIYLAENKIKRYYFERKDNQWVLEAINKIKTAYKVKNKEAENFYAFYERFSQDSVFQRRGGRLAGRSLSLPPTLKMSSRFWKPRSMKDNGLPSGLPS